MKALPNIHQCTRPRSRRAAALATSERFWLGLQADYNLEEAHRALRKQVARINRLAAQHRAHFPRAGQKPTLTRVPLREFPHQSIGRLTA